MKTAVLGAANGSFKGGNYVGTLANGGVVAGPVPRLRQQGAGLAEDRSSQQISKGIAGRLDPDADQEPGVSG